MFIVRPSRDIALRRSAMYLTLRAINIVLLRSENK
jgi:hypothetical protein